MCADGLQYPAADRDDQAGLLGDRDELVGRDHPALGVAPAQQRFQPDDTLVGEVDQWLVVQLELPTLDRVAQVRLDRHPLNQVIAQRDVEDLEPPAALLFGEVHRGVGVAQQLLRGLAAVVADRDADGGGDEHLTAVELERLDHGVDEALRDFGDRVVGAGAGGDDGELVPARARDEILLAYAAGEPCRDLEQQHVAGAVAKRVVDELEAVQVERQHADAVLQPPGVAQLGLKLALEQRAVRQPGKGILQCATAQLVLGRRAVKRARDHVRNRLHEPNLLVGEPAQPGRQVQARITWREPAPSGTGTLTLQRIPRSSTVDGAENLVSLSRSSLTTGLPTCSVYAVWVG